MGANAILHKPVRLQVLVNSVLSNLAPEEEAKKDYQLVQSMTQKKLLIIDDDVFSSGIHKTVMKNLDYDCFQCFSIADVIVFIYSYIYI